MNVLMVGIQDVTSVYIADRLEREGNSIAWFTAQKKEERHAHTRAKIYHHEYDIRSLLRVLKMQDIDTVIFHYGAYRGTVEEEQLDESRIPALQCLLSALETYKKETRLVYISTIELNHRGIETPRMAEMRYGEELVKYFSRNRKVPTIILRTGFVYGEGKLSGMGYVGHTLRKMLRAEVVECRGSKDSYVDLVYAGDVAMAVFRLLANDCSGTYYCLTGSPITLQELHDMLGRMLLKGPGREVRYLDEEETLPAEEYLRLSQPLRMDTGWFPLYLANNERGRFELQRIADQALKRAAETERNEKNHVSLRSWVKEHTFLLGLMETFLLFVMVMFLSRWTEGSSDMRYIDLRLLFVILISIQYGVRHGIVAVILACLGYIHTLRTSGIDTAYLLYDVGTWIPLIVYAMYGAVIGYVTDLRTDNMKELEEKNEMMQDRYEFLKHLQKEAIDVKEQLQHQITASHESFGKVLQITEKLSMLSPNHILYNSVDILSEMMGNCQSVIWMLDKEGSYARRKACTEGLMHVLSNTMVMADYPLLTEEFEKEKMFVNRNLDPNYPDFAMPIYRDHQPIAIVALYQMPPEQFHAYYQNLFKVLVGLIENHMVIAMLHTELTRQGLYLPDTKILNEETFRQELELAKEEKKNGHVTYLLLHIKRNDIPLPVLSKRVTSLFYAEDIMGVDAQGEIYILLMNAREEHLDSIRERFASKGVEVEACLAG